MTAGWCGSPDCTGNCAPALPRCVDCGAAITPGAAELSAAVFGRPACEPCGWCAVPPGRAW